MSVEEQFVGSIESAPPSMLPVENWKNNKTWSNLYRCFVKDSVPVIIVIIYIRRLTLVSCSDTNLRY